MKRNIFAWLLLLLMVSPVFVSCSNDDDNDEPGKNESDKNSPAYIQKTLPGCWVWSGTFLWLFKDGFSNTPYMRWTYDSRTNVLAINDSGFNDDGKIYTIKGYADDVMTCTSPAYYDYVVCSFRRASNKEFAEKFVSRFDYLFNLDLDNEDFTFDDNFNGVSSSGKKIKIKNPFYLKDNSIIYDGKEYKYDPSQE